MANCERCGAEMLIAGWCADGRYVDETGRTYRPDVGWFTTPRRNRHITGLPSA